MRYIKRLGGSCCPVPRNKKVLSIYISKEKAKSGDIVVEGELIVSLENYSKLDKAAIGIVFMSTALTGDNKIRYISLDYMNPFDPENGASSTSYKDPDTGDYHDLWPVWGGYIYDSGHADSDYNGLHYDIDGYAYPAVQSLLNSGMTLLNQVPKSSDKVTINGNIDILSTGAYMPSTGKGTISVNIEGKPSIFKYTLNNVNSVPVPYFNDGTLNKNFRATSYTISGTSTVVNIANPLADIDGKANCDKVLAYINGDNTITDINDETSTGKEFPAIMCCHLYNKGAGAGTWYLPSAGELAYIYANLKDINDARTVLELGLFEDSNYYWSSTLVGEDENGCLCAFGLNFYYGNSCWYSLYGNGGAVAVSAF